MKIEDFQQNHYCHFFKDNGYHFGNLCLEESQICNIHYICRDSIIDGIKCLSTRWCSNHGLLVCYFLRFFLRSRTQYNNRHSFSDYLLHFYRCFNIQWIHHNSRGNLSHSFDCFLFCNDNFYGHYHNLNRSDWKLDDQNYER